MLERIYWCLRGGEGHGWLGWGDAIANGAPVSCGGYILGHPWPEDGRLGPCSHPACSLMCSVEGIQACTSQAGGDDDPILVREYTVYVRQ